MFKPFIAIFRHIFTSSHRWTIAQALLLLALAILPLYSLWLIKNIIDTITTNASVNLFQLRGVLLLLGFIMVLNHILQNISSFVGEVQEQLIQDHFSGLIQEQSIALDMSYYDNPEFYNTLHRAQEEAAYRPTLILQGVLSLMQSALSVLAVGILLFYQHWAIALLLLVTAIPAVFVKVRYSRKLYEVQNQTTELNRQSWYLGWVLTKTDFAKELRLFNFGAQLRGWYKELRQQLFRAKYHVQLHRSIASAIVQVIEALAFVGAFAYVIYLAGKGMLTIGALVMYFQIFQRGQSSLQQFLQSLIQLYHNQLFIKHIYDFLQLKPRMLREKPFADLTGHVESIRFKNIFFKYPNTDRFVLKNINLEVQKGQVIALVGENGSGKTTLVKLLCRLYDATDGDILINNTHIKQLDIAQWRHRVSVIFQDFKEYHFTVKDNIRINELGMEADMPRIENAAMKTSADKFIVQMPNTYETMLGKEFRNGTELSGGQWQKIALSRAFYKDAEVIILDEPTSAIDPLAEYDIFMQLRGMAKDKILILITHRLYNLKMADCIFVMDNGELIEQGHHEKLMAIKGKYYQMFEKQV